MILKALLEELSVKLDGELYFSNLYKALYATDASVYRQLPEAVAFPKNLSDLQKLIAFASSNKTSIIPRTAGTSLAGQCVGDGIVIDVSRHFNNILELDEKEQTVSVEPGVIRDELNQYLKPFGLFFGPNTSTANRCMIGGMVGNNSSGTTSIKYGVTRDKVVQIDGFLSDGAPVQFRALTDDEFQEKLQLQNLEGKIYRNVYAVLSEEGVKQEIESRFPKPEIHRRNTGYAIDELIKMSPFTKNGPAFNMCKLLCGSEGTLVFTTKIKLKLDKLPPSKTVMIAAHYTSVADACKSVVPAMKHSLFTCELMDKVILDCTKSNKLYAPNRFFIEGDPEAILMFELRDDNQEQLDAMRDALLETLKLGGISYANPVLYGDDIDKALELRKAGLGLLGNIVGDKKAVACIEDTAVALDDLSAYIDEFSNLMKKHQQKAVYYAHAGAGELHLRPILDLKKSEGVRQFREITTDVANLVKKYQGSMSGEHGDGRVRAEFVEMMVGAENYKIFKQIKTVFDAEQLFNPGKIVNAVPMDAALRYETDRQEPKIETFLDFTDSEGVLRAVEQCNGSGDCRKTEHSSGVMCPSYHATRDEKDTTRGRANTLREFLTNSDKVNRFDHAELKEVFDLCISCKGCSSECPSNVDVATLKAEFLHQYRKANGTKLRDHVFGKNGSLSSLGSKIPWLVNSSLVTGMMKQSLGIAKERQLPKIKSFDFTKYLQSIKNEKVKLKKIILYIDEFTRYIDVDLGKDAISLFVALGYDVALFYGDSGRTHLSKGFLPEAKKHAARNIENLKGLLSEDVPLIGLEPSAILSFRDEYIRLLPNNPEVLNVSKYALLAEEFIAKEIEKGIITSEAFTNESKTIKIHAHCHQKALSDQKCTFTSLNIPKNYTVTILNTGCCGMAGSFGYEKEHYEISMKIGEQRLFPAVRKAPEAVISANGTSCRHQIFDGTGVSARHPVSILKEALR